MAVIVMWCCQQHIGRRSGDALGVEGAAAWISAGLGRYGIRFISVHFLCGFCSSCCTQQAAVLHLLRVHACKIMMVSRQVACLVAGLLLVFSRVQAPAATAQQPGSTRYIPGRTLAFVCCVRCFLMPHQAAVCNLAEVR